MTQQSTITTTLIELGLPENDAILYEILLKTPEATIPILRQKSPFSRTMLYYILQSLEQFSLITTQKVGKKTIYIAEPPSKLEEFIANQEQELKRQKNALSDIITDLTSAYRLAHHKPGIRFFEGDEGFKNALFESLNAKETIYTYSDASSVVKSVAHINKTYAQKRKEEKVHNHILTVDTPENRIIMEQYREAPHDTRFLPKNITNFRTGMQIYDNKIAYYTLRPEEKISVIIEDKDLYDMQRTMFNFFWNLVSTNNTQVSDEAAKKSETLNEKTSSVFSP